MVEGEGKERGGGAGGRVHTARHCGTLERFLHILSIRSISVQERSRLFRDKTHTNAQKNNLPLGGAKLPHTYTYTHTHTYDYYTVH